ncbi:hypothetical protein BH09PAT4_BH09PAT4_06560 [soil metagenome]
MGETTTDFYAPNKTSIEQLRLILERQSGEAVSFADAAEVGTQLLSLYECLARERNIISGGGDVRELR